MASFFDMFGNNSRRVEKPKPIPNKETKRTKYENYIQEKSPVDEIKEVHIPYGRILPEHSVTSFLPGRLYDGYYNYYKSSYDEYGNLNDYTIAIELDNEYLFNDNSPTIGNPVLGGFNQMVTINVGLDKIERTRIKRVILLVDIAKSSTYRFKVSKVIVNRGSHVVVHGGKTTMSLSELLENDLTKSYDTQDLVITDFKANLYQVNVLGINSLLVQIRESLKNHIISHFKSEVDSLRSHVSLRKNRLKFEETLSIDKVKECFIELFDNNSSDIEKIDGNDYYYKIKINLDNPSEGRLIKTLNLDDKITDILYNIAEGSNRIRGIYDCCVVSMSILGDKIIIDIKEKDYIDSDSEGDFTPHDDDYYFN
jgi:hypothetical protein